VAGQLLNISTRALVQTADQVLIGGFIISGTDAKEVIIRALGPSLTDLGVPGALADPVLELFDASGTTIARNDNWKDTQQSDIESTGLPPTNDLESAIVMTLIPSRYTAVMVGKSGGLGIGLIEVYDLAPAATSQLANISTRGFVDIGDNVMIGGLIVGGSGATSATVVLRAIGPSLSNSGISGALQDPTLELHDGNGALLAANDNWQDTQPTEIQSTGLAPTDVRESAILISLTPGNYTAIVRGKNETIGVALVEAYNVQ
jgi:hypothetical protein